MSFTQVKIKIAYRDKLKTLALKENRSMSNMLEVLIDQASTPSKPNTKEVQNEE